MQILAKCNLDGLLARFRRPELPMAPTLADRVGLHELKFPATVDPDPWAPPVRFVLADLRKIKLEGQPW